MTTRHEVKSWPLFFADVRDGRKTFELRKNDRNYQIGDLLSLNEWNPETQEGTGQNCTCRIIYVMHATGGTPDPLPQPMWGLQRGYCILGLMLVGPRP